MAVPAPAANVNQSDPLISSARVAVTGEGAELFIGPLGVVIGPYMRLFAGQGARDKSAPRRKNGGDHRGITREEVKSVEEMSTPRTPVIYEVVHRRGTALFALISYAQVLEEL